MALALFVFMLFSAGAFDFIVCNQFVVSCLAFLAGMFFCIVVVQFGVFVVMFFFGKVHVSFFLRSCARFCVDRIFRVK